MVFMFPKLIPETTAAFRCLQLQMYAAVILFCFPFYCWLWHLLISPQALDSVLCLHCYWFIATTESSFGVTKKGLPVRHSLATFSRKFKWAGICTQSDLMDRKMILCMNVDCKMLCSLTVNAYLQNKYLIKTKLTTAWWTYRSYPFIKSSCSNAFLYFNSSRKTSCTFFSEFKV